MKAYSFFSPSAVFAVIISFALVISVVPAYAAAFSSGASIVTVDKVKVRSSPNGSQIGSQEAGATGVLVDGPYEASGYSWWQIDYSSGADGWSADAFLKTSTFTGVTTGDASISPTSGIAGIYMSQTQTAGMQGSVAGASISNNDDLIKALQAQLASLLAQLQSM